MCQEISYHLRCLCHRMEVASEVALLDLETGKRSIWTEDYYPIAMVLFLRGRGMQTPSAFKFSASSNSFVGSDSDRVGYTHHSDTQESFLDPSARVI